MVGSVGVAHINVCTVPMTMLEAVRRRQALAVASCSVLRNTTTLHSSLPDIKARGQYLVGVMRSHCVADRFSCQCLFRVRQAECQTLRLSALRRVAVIVHGNIMDYTHFFCA